MPRRLKLKPYHVSYYFPRSADQGRARLYSRIVKEFDVAGARRAVQNIFKGCGDEPVIVKAYRYYRPLKSATTYIRVPYTSVSQSTATAESNQNRSEIVSPGLTALSASIQSGSGPMFPPALKVLMGTPHTFDWPYPSFEGIIDNRPAGKCPQHPDAILEADGRCPALDAGYIPGRQIFIPNDPDLATIVAKIIKGTSAPAAAPDCWTDSNPLPVEETKCEDPATCGSSEYGCCGTYKGEVEQCAAGPAPGGPTPDDYRNAIAAETEWDTEPKEPSRVWNSLIPLAGAATSGLIVVYLLYRFGIIK